MQRFQLSSVRSDYVLALVRARFSYVWASASLQQSGLAITRSQLTKYLLSRAERSGLSPNQFFIHMIMHEVPVEDRQEIIVYAHAVLQALACKMVIEQPKGYSSKLAGISVIGLMAAFTDANYADVPTADVLEAFDISLQSLHRAYQSIAGMLNVDRVNARWLRFIYSLARYTSPRTI